MSDAIQTVQGVNGTEVAIPSHLGWTGNWEVESQRAGQEFSRAKTEIENALCRVFLIWRSGIWTQARSPRTVDNDTGEVLENGQPLFNDFEDVLLWFQERYGMSRSSVWQRIKTYERMAQIGTPMEISMASMSHMQTAATELLDRVFEFEPRTYRLKGLRPSASTINLPGVDGDLDMARHAVVGVVVGSIRKLMDGEATRSTINAEIRHDILGDPMLFFYPRENGDLEVAWETGSDRGQHVLNTGSMPESVRKALWGRIKF